jgi:hypothetical protein
LREREERDFLVKGQTLNQGERVGNLFMDKGK